MGCIKVHRHPCTRNSAPTIVAALVSALPSAATAARDSNSVHGILLMATALLRGLLATARNAEETEEAATQTTALLAPLLHPAFLATLVEDKAWLITGEPCPPPVRHEALQLLLACHHLLRLATPSADGGGERQRLSSLLKAASKGRVLEEQGLALLVDSAAPPSSIHLPPIPGLAALVAWSTRWHLLLSLSDDAPQAFAVRLARGLGQRGLLEVRRESLRVLLLLLGRRGGEGDVLGGVDLGEGRTEDEKGEEQWMMEQQAGDAAAVTATLWVEAEAALVAQVQREENPNLLKGQLAALCLLLGGEAQEARLRVLEGLRVFVTRLARQEAEAADEEDGGEIAARALELLGHLMPPQSTEGDAATTRLWLRRVERAACPEGRPSLRMAALRSIAASGLLRQGWGEGRGSGGAVVVGALLTTLRLAHDDDDAVQDAACTLLAASLVDGSGAYCGERAGNLGAFDITLISFIIFPPQATPAPPRPASTT